MKKIVLPVLFAAFFITSVSSQTFKINSKRNLKTSKGVICAFFSDINSGKFDDALLLFKEDPIKKGEISLEEFTWYVGSKISRDGSIVSINLTEEKVEDNKNAIKMNIIIYYNDNTQQKKWVLLEKDQNDWKLTIRGSLF